MPEIYDQGEVVRLEASFQKDGVLVDPATVSLTITDPAGTATVVTLAAAQIERLELGRFRYDHTLGGSAVVGTWEAVWATTTPAVRLPSTFEVRANVRAEIVRSVRRRWRDRPSRFLVNDNPLTSGALAITVADPVEAGKVLHAGQWMEFDDGTDEVVVSTASGDTSDGVVAIARGQDGTPARSHVQGTAVLIEPRARRLEVLETASEIVNTELWPHVWVPGEFPLTFQSSNEYYPAPVPDIETIVFAYQIVAGQIITLRAQFLSPVLSDDANFPNGAIVLPYAADASAIHVGYRARPTLSNLTTELRSLVVLGTLARMQIIEESGGVAPDSGTLDNSITPGSRLRAGLVEWGQFVEARAKLHVTLTEAEEARQRPVRRGVA